jgi:predicted porin
MEMTMIGGLMKREASLQLLLPPASFRRAQWQPTSVVTAARTLRSALRSSRQPRHARATARFSLEISGQVNELVYWWDNGDESNVYQGTSGFSSSRFRMKGSANINEDWSAGYLIEIETKGAQVNAQSASNDDGGASIGLRHSMWYLKSKRLGQISMGLYSFAADDINSSIAVGGTSTAAAGNYDGAPGMGLNFGGTGVAVKDVFDIRDVDRGNLIRYDSPSIAGFVFSAAWGEDDRWDVALRYAGEFNGIKIAAGIGYHEDTEPEQGPQPTNYNELRTAGGILHVPTGLFVDAGWMRREFDPTGAQPNIRDDFTFWYVRPGIYRKWNALGKTSFFGEYGEADGSGMANVRNFNENEGKFYGIGLQQEVDAAAMELYIGWRHFEADLTDGAGLAVSADDVDTVYTGARIKF